MQRTENEIRETIDRSGCDLFAFFQGDAGSTPKPDDECFIHSIMEKAAHATVDYRGNKDFSVLVLVPARRLTDEEIEEIEEIEATRQGD